MSLNKTRPTPQKRFISISNCYWAADRSSIVLIKYCVGFDKRIYAAQHQEQDEEEERDDGHAIDHHIESLCVSSFYYSHVHVMMAINGLDTHMVMVTDKWKRVRLLLEISRLLLLLLNESIIKIQLCFCFYARGPLISGGQRSRGFDGWGWLGAHLNFSYTLTTNPNSTWNPLRRSLLFAGLLGYSRRRMRM